MEPKNILITGNGFDLALGYKTKYKDFMNFISKSQNLNFEDFVLFIKNEWKIDQLDLNDAKTFYNLLEKNNNNFLINYFKNYHLKTLNWADFELELLHIAQCLEGIITAIQSDETKITGENIWLSYNGDLKYYSNYLIFMNNNPYFLISENVYEDKKGERWLILNIRDKKCINNSSDIRVAILKFISRLPEIYYSELLSLSELFESYLVIESKRKILSPKIKYSITNVITYNYTNFYSEISKTVFHVNGAVSEKNKMPIFGVDSEARFKTSYFLSSTKEIQRASNGIRINAISNICEKASCIYIFGFSLTAADADSIKLIFKKVKERNGLCRVFVYYKAKQNTKDDILAKMQLNNNLKQILNEEYSKIIDYVSFVDSNDFFNHS